jgi:hypothetical protein
MVFLLLISFSGVLWATFLLPQEGWRMLGIMIFGLIGGTNMIAFTLYLRS